MTKCDQKTSRDNFFLNFMCIREGLVWHCRRWVSTPFAARLVFCCFFTQLINKLQQCSLCEWIKNILLFVLNTKQPLRDIWLLSYKKNSFQCVLKKSKFWIFSKTLKTVLLISQQPDVAQRLFCIQIILFLLLSNSSLRPKTRSWPYFCLG